MINYMNNRNKIIEKYIKKPEKYTFNKKYLTKENQSYFKSKIGLYDPYAKNVNPFTLEEYQNLYQNNTIEYKSGPLEGITVPKTYRNLAYLWTNFKVYEYLNPILKSIHTNQITIIRAGTGVGKTVIVPKIALQAFNFQKKVICSVPKRILALDNSTFSSECLDVKLGEEVGYFYMGENVTNDNTKLIFTTPGSLKSLVTRDDKDPFLSDYECIILDEIHERSVQTDQLLLFMKSIMEKRPDFRLILMSATLSLSIFEDYFTKKSNFSYNVIDIPGKSFNVDIFYQKQTLKPNMWKQETIKKIIQILNTTESGDILVFIKSGSEGNALCNELNSITKKLSNINPFCVILEAKSSKEQKEYAINEFKYKSHPDMNVNNPYTRKIVMATNIVESSLTVNGIVYVIDNGYSLEASYFPKKNARSLVETRISKAAATQRSGRAGRTMNGYCYRIYTEKDFKNFSDFPVPDVQKTDITNDILDLFMLNYIKNTGDVRLFLKNLISPPSEDFIQSSLKKLYGTGSITNINNSGIVTPLGKAISNFRSIEINMAKTILASYEYYCKNDVISIILICIKLDGRIENLFDIRPNKKLDKKYQDEEIKIIKNLHKKKFYSPYGDYITILNVYNSLKKYMESNTGDKNAKLWCKENGISSNVFINKFDKKNWDMTKINSNKIKYILSSIYNPIKDKNTIQIDEDFLEQNINIPKNKILNMNKNSNKNSNSKTENISFFPNAKKFVKDQQNKIYVGKDINNILYKRRKRIELTKDEMNKIQKYDEKFNNIKILTSFALSNNTNIAKLVNKKNNIYQTTFPIEKVLAKMDRSTTLLKNPDYIMYYELFTTSNEQKLLKLNLTTEIPKDIINMLKKNNKNFIK